MDNKNVIAGRYELIEKIGDGGMAVVYKAKCRLLKRFVAVKILKPEFTKDIKFVENFRRGSQFVPSKHRKYFRCRAGRECKLYSDGIG